MSAESVRIRPAQPADLDSVAAIYAHYVLKTLATFDEVPPTAEDWRAKAYDLHARRLPFLVTEVDWEVAGFAYASPWRPMPAYRHTAENSIYIAPEHAGKGLGRVLLGTLLPLCADAGIQRLLAVIADGGESDTSTRLHKSFGFVEAGRLVAVGYKHDRWLDTVLYQLELSPRPAQPTE